MILPTKQLHQNARVRNLRSIPSAEVVGELGTIVGTESHGSNPWTRFTVAWDNGKRFAGATLGFQIELV
jgi:hypothetical protein